MTASTVYQGVVTGLGPMGLRAAVLVENYGYIVFDTDGPHEVDRGDLITGLARSHGSQTARNETQGRALRIYVEAYDAGSASADILLKAG